MPRPAAFSFALARKLLSHYEGTPLHLDMRSVLDKIAESLEGDVTIEPDWLCERVGVMPEDRVRIDPAVWRNWRASLSDARRSGQRTRPSTGANPRTASRLRRVAVDKDDYVPSSLHFFLLLTNC